MYVSRDVDEQAGRGDRLIAVPNGTPPAGGLPGRVVGPRHQRHGRRVRAVARPASTTSRSRTRCSTRAGSSPRATTRAKARPGLHAVHRRRSARRATRSTSCAPPANCPPRTRATHYVVWGHSEGGHTAMFALNIGTDVRARAEAQGRGRGRAAVAVRAHLRLPEDQPVPLLPVDGGRRAATRRTATKPRRSTRCSRRAGMKLIPMLDKGCTGYLVRAAAATLDVRSSSKGDPFKVPAWKKLLDGERPAVLHEARARRRC